MARWPGAAATTGETRTLGRDPKFGHWRDTHVRMKGPAALTAQLSFAEG
jgi:hypothetical protein